jgi:putative transposase
MAHGTASAPSPMFRMLANQNENRVQEGHLMPDHMMLSIPPKHAISQAVGYIKGVAQAS